MKNLQFPQIQKIIVNSGVGRQAQDANFREKVLPELINEFAAITGQKPSSRGARKSIASFKLRMGTPIGLMATLRRGRKDNFLYKVLNVVFPRVRDFRGIPESSIDASGNLSFGFKEQLVFPEISPELSKVNFGIQVTVVPQAVKNRTEAVALYRKIGIPFKKS